MSTRRASTFDSRKVGQNATLDFTWDHSIDATAEREASGFTSMFFIPDMDLHYKISGSYEVTGVAATYQLADLSDVDFGRLNALSV